MSSDGPSANPGGEAVTAEGAPSSRPAGCSSRSITSAAPDWPSASWSIPETRCLAACCRPGPQPRSLPLSRLAIRAFSQPGQPTRRSPGRYPAGASACHQSPAPPPSPPGRMPAIGSSCLGTRSGRTSWTTWATPGRCCYGRTAPRTSGRHAPDRWRSSAPAPQPSTDAASRLRWQWLSPIGAWPSPLMAPTASAQPHIEAPWPLAAPLWPCLQADWISATRVGTISCSPKSPGTVSWQASTRPAPTQHAAIFSRRGRLLACMTGGTVIVEAPQRSRALGAARQARELCRPVMTVPGPVDSETSAGSNELLREHDVVCVTCAADVLAAMGLTPYADPREVPGRATASQRPAAQDPGIEL